MKLALHSLSGKPVRWFHVNPIAFDATPAVSRRPSHHVILADRSGSMWGDIGDLKATLEKLLTLTEFDDPSVKASLISYSSSGDVRLHFAKVTVQDVMRAGSPYLGEIRTLRSTGLTCISQALHLAETLVDDSDVTCISLHTDGYANDRSASAEQRGITEALDKLAKHSNVFVNTIAYRQWCDFTLLSSIANRMSGACIQAEGIRQVYEALHKAQSTLAGSLAPAVEIKVENGNFVLFLSCQAGKVLISHDDLQVRGLAADVDKSAWRFREVSEADYQSLPDSDGYWETNMLVALARAAISEGDLTLAKQAVSTAHLTNMLTRNYRALVPEDVATFAQDLEGYLFHDLKDFRGDKPGLELTGPTVLDVLDVFRRFPGAVLVHMDTLTAGYKRRGLKRVAGVRKDDGTLEVPKYETRDKNPGTTFLPITSVDVNRAQATANILVPRPVVLVDKAAKLDVVEVMGVRLDDLMDFKNYTVVGDGKVCIPKMVIRVTDKRAWKELRDLGIVTGDMNPQFETTVHLGELPVVDFDKDYTVHADDVRKLMRLTALSKILSAVLKDKSEALTAEQIAALKEHCLSANKYLNFPTTNEYTDLKDALNKGDVDTRVSYEINVGTSDITDIGKVPSANAFLERRFTLMVDGKPVDKPKFADYFNPTAVWGVKTLSAKVKITAIDNFLYMLFSDFLGLPDGDLTTSTEIRLAGVLTGSLGYTMDQVAEVLAVVYRKTTGDAAVETLSKLQRDVTEAIDGIWATVAPMVFYVGSTGLLPATYSGVKALTVEQFEKLFPDTSLSKDERDATFFVLPGNVLVTVFAKNTYFTVPKPATTSQGQSAAASPV